MYCFVQEVAAPVEMYDGLHAAMKARAAGRDLGMLLHLTRASESGFTIIEVWSSRQAYDQAFADVILPAMRDFFGGEPPFEPPPLVEFEPRGLIIPSADVLI